MTFFAGGMLLVSQKPAGKSPGTVGADDGGAVAGADVGPEDGADDGAEDGGVVAGAVAGAVACVGGTTVGGAVWPAEPEPQPTRAIPDASNEPIKSLVIESIRAVSYLSNSPQCKKKRSMT
jgi:hypothetical protein